jgi:hypothetical protein
MAEHKRDIIDAVSRVQQELQTPISETFEIVSEIASEIASVYHDNCNNLFAFPQKWMRDLHYEYEEWDEIIREWSTSDSGIGWATYQHAYIVPDEIRRLLPTEKQSYRICDVVSGPRCWMGNSIEGKTVELVCCDPLAEYYVDCYDDTVDGDITFIVKKSGGN